MVEHQIVDDPGDGHIDREQVAEWLRQNWATRLNDQTIEQATTDLAKYFMPMGEPSETQHAGSLDDQASLDWFQKFQKLREECADEPPAIFFSVRTYNQLHYWAHIAHAYPLPRRKLRKCHMRRLHARRRAARGRYGL